MYQQQKRNLSSALKCPIAVFNCISFSFPSNTPCSIKHLPIYSLSPFQNLIPRSFNKSFFLSLTTADLILGLFVFPFCFVSGLDPEWRDGWRHPHWIPGDIICHVEAYLATICFVASIYSLMWISVDHYIAIRKPERYLVSPILMISPYVTSGVTGEE